MMEGLLIGFLSLLSHSTQDHLPRDGTVHGELISPTLITTGFLTGHLVGHFLNLGFLFPNGPVHSRLTLS